MLWVGGEPGKTAGPILRGAARSRTLQEGPNVCCGFRAHPPTQSGCEHWSYFGSGRFGDTMQWRTRSTRGARNWDASATPRFLRSGNLSFSAIAFFRGSHLAHIKYFVICVSCPRNLDTTSSDAPMQTWKQVRGPAGAVMCETRDLGIKWPYWHALIFGDKITIDMRFGCPKDVKQMLVQTARSVYLEEMGSQARV